MSVLILSGTFDLLQRVYARILLAATDKPPQGRMYFIYWLLSAGAGASKG